MLLAAPRLLEVFAVLEVHCNRIMAVNAALVEFLAATAALLAAAGAAGPGPRAEQRDRRFRRSVRRGPRHHWRARCRHAAQVRQVGPAADPEQVGHKEGARIVRVDAPPEEVKLGDLAVSGFTAGPPGGELVAMASRCQGGPQAALLDKADIGGLTFAGKALERPEDDVVVPAVIERSEDVTGEEHLEVAPSEEDALQEAGRAAEVAQVRQECATITAVRHEQAAPSEEGTTQEAGYAAEEVAQVQQAGTEAVAEQVGLAALVRQAGTSAVSAQVGQVAPAEEVVLLYEEDGRYLEAGDTAEQVVQGVQAAGEELQAGLFVLAPAVLGEHNTLVVQGTQEPQGLTVVSAQGWAVAGALRAEVPPTAAEVAATHLELIVLELLARTQGSQSCGAAPAGSVLEDVDAVASVPLEDVKVPFSQVTESSYKPLTPSRAH